MAANCKLEQDALNAHAQVRTAQRRRLTAKKRQWELQAEQRELQDDLAASRREVVTTGIAAAKAFKKLQHASAVQDELALQVKEATTRVQEASQDVSEKHKAYLQAQSLEEETQLALRAAQQNKRSRGKHVPCRPCCCCPCCFCCQPVLRIVEVSIVVDCSSICGETLNAILAGHAEVMNPSPRTTRAAKRSAADRQKKSDSPEAAAVEEAAEAPDEIDKKFVEILKASAGGLSLQCMGRLLDEWKEAKESAAKTIVL